MTRAEHRAKLLQMGEGVARECAGLLAKLEADPAFAGKHPQFLDGLTQSLAPLHALGAPIPSAAEILGRAAALRDSPQFVSATQAQAVIAKAMTP